MTPMIRKEDQDLYVSKARELYADDDLEIDDNPNISVAENGMWVAAWVWVSDDDMRAAE